MAATYRKAGVDVAGADRWLARMRPLMRSTRQTRVLSSGDRFAGLFRLNGLGMRDPVLVASADGAGTKITVAQATGLHMPIGVDVVAMNVNDLVTFGARPLFFLDYLAVGRLQPSVMTALFRGIVRGCRESDCALLGGETAEMPGVYRAGEYDVAGFAVGVVERRKMIDGSRLRAHDVLVGLASSGVHANGFSLVRRVLNRRQLLRLKRQLMAPTRIYVRLVLRVSERVRLSAIAHITGGGLTRRLQSLTTRHRGLRVALNDAWRVPPVFRAIQRAGRVSDAEMHRTFNMGIGMVLVCRPADVRTVVQMARRAGTAAWLIGTIERQRS